METGRLKSEEKTELAINKSKILFGIQLRICVSERGDRMVVENSVCSRVVLCPHDGISVGCLRLPHRQFPTASRDRYLSHLVPQA